MMFIIVVKGVVRVFIEMINIGDRSVKLKSNIFMGFGIEFSSNSDLGFWIFFSDFVRRIYLGDDSVFLFVGFRVGDFETEILDIFGGSF